MTGQHYFSPAPSGDLTPRTIEVHLAGAPRAVVTAGGVFSPDHLDTGTRVLLETVPPPPEDGHLLDLGCGWGPLALSLALASPAATVWAVDVNERALELTRRNALAHGATNINAVHPADVPADVRFAAIWSNPPIRIGKANLHALLREWLPRLDGEREAWLVVQRNLGSDSLHRWLDQDLPEHEVSRAATSKGFRVLRAARRA